MLKDEIEAIKRAVPDERVRQLCFCREFDDDDFLKTKSTIYKYFNGLMQTAFFFVYGRYKQWELSERYLNYKKEKATKNFNRIVSILEGLYEKHPLSHEAISEVLTDIQIDIAFAMQDNHEYDSKIYQSLNDLYLKHDIERNNHKYAEYDYLARLYVGTNGMDERLSDVDANSTLQQRRQDVVQLVSNTFKFFSFLKANEVKIDKLQYSKRENDKIIFEYVDDLKEIEFEYHNLSVSPDRKKYELPENISTKFTIISSLYSDYYLVDLNNPVDSNGKPYLVFNYHPYENYEQENMRKRIFVFGSDTPDSDIPEGEYFIRDDEILTDLIQYFFKSNNRAEKRIKILEDFSTVNFKYIRVLSLAIADILDIDLIKRLFHVYGKKYPLLFNDRNRNGILEESEIPDIDWESSIAVLLIEESAVNVLRTLLFWNFLNNRRLHYELNLNLQTRLGIDNYNAYDIIDKCDDEAEKIRNNWVGSSRIDSIANDLKDEFLNEAAFIKGNVYSTHMVSKLLEAFGESSSLMTKYSMPASIKARGVWLNEINKVVNFDKKLESLKLLTTQTLIHLICFYEGFIKYVTVKRKLGIVKSKEEAKQAQHLVVEAFSSKYKETFNELNTHDGDIEYIISKVELLNNECKNGKNYNFDKYYFARNFLGRSELFKMEFFEPLAGLASVNDEEGYCELMKAVRMLFEYLSPGKNETDEKVNNDKELAIYPYIATYVFEQKTKDGYMVKQFDVSDYGDSFSIRVLSEFKFTPNNTYYCLPNALRYNKDINIWIEPILIDSEIFDNED